jgi:hypothetical protein
MRLRKFVHKFTNCLDPSIQILDLYNRHSDTWAAWVSWVLTSSGDRCLVRG